MLRIALALLLLLAGCAGLPGPDDSVRLGEGEATPTAEPTGWQTGDPVPSISMTEKEVRYEPHGKPSYPAWLFTVSDIRRAPIPYDVVVIKIDGCTWYDQSERGNVEVSDTILCHKHDVLTLVHAPSGEGIYSNCNGCGTPLPSTSPSTSPEPDPLAGWPWYVRMKTTTTDDPPTMRIDEVEDGHRWDELLAKASGTPLRVQRNDPAHSNDLALGQTWVSLWSSSIRESDTLYFCSQDGSDNFSLRLSAAGADNWEYAWSSSGVDPCTAVQPAIAWSVSQADVSASVTSADPGANWAEFEMRLDRSGELMLNGGSSLTMPAGAFVQLMSGGIGGGDTISFCADVAGQLQATLRHIETNSIAREFTFNNAGAC